MRNHNNTRKNKQALADQYGERHGSDWAWPWDPGVLTDLRQHGGGELPQGEFPVLLEVSWKHGGLTLLHL